MRFLRSPRFWLFFAVSAGLFGTLMAWETGLFGTLLPSPPRGEVGALEKIFASTIVLLIGLNVGLFAWRSKEGTCPIGTRRATGMAGALGAVTLLCPVCLLLPFTFLGASFTLVFLTPYLPLLRIISLILLLVSAVKLWPHPQPPIIPPIPEKG